MDMGKAFIRWVKEHLPSAQIVFDHFHVIKLMNEKLDQVRRRIVAKLDAAERAILKNQRFTLLQNTAQNGRDHITALEWNSGIPAFREHDQCLYGRFQ